MAYSSDISGLGADHHWKFDGDSTDEIASVDGTDTSVVYTDSAIAKDATNCLTMNATSDRVSIPNQSDINSSDMSRKTVAGWFATTAIQEPPKRIYGEGDDTQSFAFILGWGNNVIFEVDDPNFTIQIFGDTFLEPDRVYHLCMVFEGSGYGNELHAYLDGVEQLSAYPSDRQPDAERLTARGVAEFGDPAGTVAVGGKEVILNCPVNGKWQHWCTFESTGAILTDTEVRETLFERGALADITISSDTETNMQTAIDAYADTTRSDAPVCIDIAAVSGGGDFTLDLDNIKFDDLASCHIRYTGTSGTLTIRNTNGANCSITASPWGGDVEVFTEVTVKVTVKDATTKSVVQNARVLLKTDPGGTAVIDRVLTNASGIVSTTYDYSTDQIVAGVIRQGSASTYYRQGELSATITEDGLDQIVLLVPDE